MKKNLSTLLILALVLLAACSTSPLSRKQVKILGPYEIDIALDGSVKKALKAHPNHRAAGNGIFWYEVVSPDKSKRRVRLHGVIDTILWLQVQDEPIAPDLANERLIFSHEIERLEMLLGPAQKDGGPLAARRSARWTLPNGSAVELRLELNEEMQTARRAIALGQTAHQPYTFWILE